MIKLIGKKTNRGVITRVLCTAVVLHDGWEMDNEAWCVEFEDGTRGLMTTSHGWPYILDSDDFEDKLKETEESAASIRKLIGLVKQGA